MKTPLLTIVPAALTTLVLVTLPAASLAEPDTRTLADTCAMCHGTDGKSPGSIDELFGESTEEFAEEMLEFKSGLRHLGGSGVRIGPAGHRPITRCGRYQPLRASREYRQEEAQDAEGWYQSIVADSFA